MATKEDIDIQASNRVEATHFKGVLTTLGCMEWARVCRAAVQVALHQGAQIRHLMN